MDQFLYDYLLSGKAWLLVGSGPSIAMGYPKWGELASIAIETLKTEQPKVDLEAVLSALAKCEYPRVFTEAKKGLGGPRLLQLLRNRLKPNRGSNIYGIIAQWPVPVYMTTNYDNELQSSLAAIGLAYTPYSNSEDHMSALVPDFTGGIVKLHGDLTTENGLILTQEDYQEITASAKWEYWRTKMAAILQMNRVIVIGHSLSDRNVRHVLEAAKRGAGVNQPVVWIAPNVSQADRKMYLNQYRIRVIPYEDRDGEHKNLVSLLKSIGEFVPPRSIIKIKEQIEKVVTPTKPHVAAAGFFVFNVLCQKREFEQKRLDIVSSAIQASLPELMKIGKFDMAEALTVSGWPTGTKMDATFVSAVANQVVKMGLVSRSGDKFQVNEAALNESVEKRKIFELMRERFKRSLALRVRKEFSELNDKQVELVSEGIENSLVQYFREGGVTLASILFSKGTGGTMPGSVLTFMTAASTQYDDLTMRLAFFKTSVDCFLHSESAEVEYLGRLSQGLFAYYGLGVFGDVAADRLKLAKETVWLIDSDTQIRALALGSSANALFRGSLSRLKQMGLRFFTPDSLMSETVEHLRYADNVVKENGQNSPLVISAAKGEAPFRKQNAFMEGFIGWQAAGNRCDWGDYLFNSLGARNFDEVDMRKALKSVGIEAVDLSVWPGFSKVHYAEIEEYVRQIASIWGRGEDETLEPDTDVPMEPFRKAKPEAEAYSIVLSERKGQYHIISADGVQHPSWFISHTSMLNILKKGVVITWQPESFLSFASTLCEVTDADLAREAFERILLGLAQSGFSTLDDVTIGRVFGGVIEQAKLDIGGLRQEYEETLQKKYGEPLESVLARVPAAYYAEAVTQLAAEIAQHEADRRRVAEAQALAASQRADKSERELSRVQKYRTKLLRKKSGKKAARKQKRK